MRELRNRPPRGAQGLEGTFTVQEALARILKGTKFTLKVDAGGTVLAAAQRLGVTRIGFVGNEQYMD